MSAVIWHDLECGSYTEDLTLWRSLAETHGGPILDVGAGTGRVSVPLARAGHQVFALDRDPDFLAALRARADGLPVRTVLADAREFTIDEPVALCLVPMQTIQLLGGPGGRATFLRSAREAVRPGGLVVMAIAAELDEFDAEAEGVAPLPDICERDGIVYSSLPTAVRADGDGFVLERRREIVDRSGTRTAEEDRIRLDRLGIRQLEGEGRAAGLTPAQRLTVPPTPDYVGSEVVVLRV